MRALEGGTVHVMCAGFNFMTRSSAAQKVTCVIKARISECSGNCICTACFKHTKSPNLAHTMYSYVSYNRQSKLIISLHSRKWFVVIQSRKWLVVRPVCYLCSLNWVSVYYSYILHAQYGCAMAQALIHQPYSLGSTPGWSMYVCGMRSGTGRSFLLSTSVCACHYHSLMLYTHLYMK